MTEMHLQNNELNDRKYQSYVKSEKAERPGTIRQKKKRAKQQQQIWCGGRIRIRNYDLNYFATISEKNHSLNYFIPLSSR